MLTDLLCSGDNKTEKAARSAQVALVDNGSMTDTLGFIEGTVIIIIMIPSASVISLNINLTDHKPECFSKRLGDLNIYFDMGPRTRKFVGGWQNKVRSNRP